MNKSPEWQKLNCAESQKFLRIDFILQELPLSCQWN